MAEEAQRAGAAAGTIDVIAEAARQWATVWGEGPIPSMEAVTSLMRAQQILTQRLNTLLREHGLTFPRYEALMILYLSRRGALPLGKIGARLQVHATSVTNLVDGLERSGLARREPDPGDRRTTLAAITARGRATAEAATAALNDERFCTGPLRRSDLEAITSALRRLRADEDGFDLRASGAP
jgi:DNA-binding MarR family transcriptional regulator